MKLQGIKNIIFDLGDVIININHNKAIASFQKLLGNDFSIVEKRLTANNILKKYETAEISTDEFISFFKNFKSSLTNQEIVDAWNSMLFDIPKGRIAIINQLAKQYRVFLLSNTNEIHLKYIDDYVKTNFQMDAMSVPFEKAYYSHQMGLRKPNPEIFKTILNDKNLVAEETLFIDDAEEHIITAKQLNLKTYHLISPETIVDIFK
jgi:putative hydrolase of the HAD superfamily